LEIKGLLSKRPKDARKLIGKMFPWEDVSGVSKSVRKGKPFVVSNTRDLPLRSKVRKHCLEMGAKSVLGTGMFFGRKLLGILSVTSISEYRTFSSEEIKLVQTMANQIAVAIENARLLEVVRKHTQDLHGLSSQLMEVQEKERKRIAQELHDQVGQMLQSMRMNLGRIKRDLGSRSEEPKGKEDWLLDTEELLDQTIEDIRTLTSDLSPPMLVDFGLIPTLRWYIESYGKRSGIKVSLRAKEKGYRLSQDIEFSLFRIIQEALTNVFKHARATEASVSVSKKDSSVIMSVRDNGVGFDPRETLSPPKGMGLFGIKERVNLLGGNFEIISRPRKGTTLNINIPFSEVKYEEGQTTGG
jgi:signal transduction histidine kinase